MESEKKGYDDLASLFLPDILNQSLGNINHRPHSDNSVQSRNLPQHSPQHLHHHHNLPPPRHQQSPQERQVKDIDTFIDSSEANFADFLSNNDFINWKVPEFTRNDMAAMRDLEHTNHYSNFITPDASMHHHHNHNHVAFSQLLSNTPQAQGYKHMDSNLMVAPGTELDARFIHDNPLDQILYLQQQQMIQSFPQDELASGSISRASEEIEDKKVKKRKRAIQYQPNAGIVIDNRMEKLVKLLDLKCKKINNDFKLLDQKENEIAIEFKGFLNGKLLTNDIDNSRYIYASLDKMGHNGGLEGKIIKSDPKVISCYRRNFIQVSLNFNLSGFKNYEKGDSKILKLKTDEYGYSITRVVKWFKLVITAHSGDDNQADLVPIQIEEIAKEKKDEKWTSNDDIINPNPLTSSEHIITLNNSDVINGDIDNYYTIKKLRFRNATSNNGNVTVQHYYHLKIKLSAIVADLYYDDYIDEDFLVANPDSSRNEINLFELESEPIIVRGRNPSFYAEKKDILAQGRSRQLKQSYKSCFKPHEAVNFEFSDQGSKDEPDKIEKSQSHFKPDQVVQDNPEVEMDDADSGDDDGSDQDIDEEDDKIRPTTSNDDEDTSRRKSSPSTSALSHNSKPATLNLESIGKDGNHYTYFPISNVYYLPPINVVYFPHGAHQHINQLRTSSPAVDEKNVPARRKSSNVYFK